MKLRIEKLVYQGYGLAREEGKVVFVPFSVPGDLVEAEIIDERKDFAFAAIKEVLEPSLYRRDPGCELFGRCGGCQWLNVDYKKQLEEKREILVRELSSKGISAPEPEIVHAKPFHYRRRARFAVSNRLIGFFHYRRNEVVPVGRCLQITEKMNEALLVLYSFISLLKKAEEIWMGEDVNSTQFLVCAKAKGKVSEIHEIYHALKEKLKIRVGVRIKYSNKISTLGIEGIKEKIKGKTIFYEYESFFQSNRFLTTKLIEIVASEAKRFEPERIVELHAGAGTFTVFLSEIAKELFAVEISKKAVKCLEKSLKENNISNVKVVRESAEEFIKKLDHTPDLIVLDPPRTGAKEIAERISEIKPKAVIYISCNPTTLSRDIALMKGYVPEKVFLIDMFPHTFHIETVVVLTP